MQRETRGGGQGGGGAKKNSVEERGGFASKTEQDPRKNKNKTSSTKKLVRSRSQRASTRDCTSPYRRKNGRGVGVGVRGGREQRRPRHTRNSDTTLNAECLCFFLFKSTFYSRYFFNLLFSLSVWFFSNANQTKRDEGNRRVARRRTHQHKMATFRIRGGGEGGSGKKTEP